MPSSLQKIYFLIDFPFSLREKKKKKDAQLCVHKWVKYFKQNI